MSTFADVKHENPSTLYHYTSQSGLLGIIKEKKLRLSSIRHLNDAAELSHALEIMHERLPRFPKPPEVSEEVWNTFSEQVLGFIPSLELIDYYVGSFSRNKDQLSQWRAYSGGGVGFSIGFDRQRLNDLAAKQDLVLRPCVYDLQEQRNRVDGVIRESAERITSESSENAMKGCVVIFLLMSPRLKHPSFREEEEWRLISKPQFARREPDDFRTSGSMLVPYRIFDLREKDEQTPISEVVVGPAPHMRLSAASVSALLRKYHIEGATVSLSEVPYRNW